MKKRFPIINKHGVYSLVQLKDCVKDWIRYYKWMDISKMTDEEIKSFDKEGEIIIGFLRKAFDISDEEFVDMVYTISKCKTDKERIAFMKRQYEKTKKQ